jgi:hypothetical protein
MASSGKGCCGGLPLMKRHATSASTRPFATVSVGKVEVDQGKVRIPISNGRQGTDCVGHNGRNLIQGVQLDQMPKRDGKQLIVFDYQDSKHLITSVEIGRKRTS